VFADEVVVLECSPELLRRTFGSTNRACPFPLAVTLVASEELVRQQKGMRHPPAALQRNLRPMELGCTEWSAKNIFESSEQVICVSTFCTHSAHSLQTLSPLLRRPECYLLHLARIQAALGPLFLQVSIQWRA
jgi:hypothetical protein